MVPNETELFVQGIYSILTETSSWSKGTASSASSCTEESALTVTDPLLTVYAQKAASQQGRTNNYTQYIVKGAGFCRSTRIPFHKQQG